MTADQITILGAAVLAGVTGSLHCIGMCGPLVAGLGASLGRGRSFWSSAAGYHAGRLWTYALLGLVAGTFGSGVRWALAGRRWLAIAFGAVIVLNGLSLLLPGGSALGRAAASRFGAAVHRVLNWAGLGGRTGFGARFLVGALMGFIPCGLVYAMLIPAAAMPAPPLSALAMLVFGLGTVPALTAVVAAERWASPRLRRRGRALVALLLVAAGGWMIYRSTAGGAQGTTCPVHPAAEQAVAVGRAAADQG